MKQREVAKSAKGSNLKGLTYTDWMVIVQIGYLFQSVYACCPKQRTLTVWSISDIADWYIWTASALFAIKLNDAKRMKRALMQFADNAGPDQPVHSHRLIWAFAVR